MGTSPETLRALIVDDEALARERLRALLESDGGVAIVGEAASGTQAVERVRELRPDLVLLDVQMPGLDGFGVLRALDSEPLPAVIFVTAHDEHAIRAFDVEAVDYVLKPVTASRLRDALRRVRDRRATSDAAALSRTLSEALGRMQSGAAEKRLALRDGDRVTFVDLSAIDRVDAEGDYARVRTGARSHLIRETLTSIEQRLPANAFVRIHRSVIVAVDRIRAIEPWTKGDYVVTLTDGTRLTTGRTYRERVRALLP